MHFYLRMLKFRALLHELGALDGISAYKKYGKDLKMGGVLSLIDRLM